ncbi:serine/threonine-protein kinase [Stieleria varia]|uniref:Serine/threonine-protein kinase PrkC n=1 Tax=Stieleria varia TaxID=2528005 RepID=A0A5C6AYS4_9BACT|nr:serine/threonine-protein kinase [Stieleria varia]TWU04309.1 Serine/threonine-protein kinase PrkC [Stieleria varia]
MTVRNCPTALEYQHMLQGEVSARRLEELGEHLTECSDCSQLIERFPDDGELHRAVAQSTRFVDHDDAVRRAIENARSIFQDASFQGTSFLDAASDTLFDTVQQRSDATLTPNDSFAAYHFLSPPVLPDEIGRLGKYRILQVLGQGGMGVVFRANDPELERDVAMKVIFSGRPVSQALRQRFAREAKALASVEHDHVVPVYSVETAGETPLLTMKLLVGQTLADRLRGAASLDQAIVASIGQQLASALHAAHSAGVIHRDIKPGNIWIEESGNVKLIDFGLARTNDFDLTSAESMLGTPKYMSPEQANGQVVVEQSDLFSVGSVLYHCLTGKPPFEADSVIGVLRKIADGDYVDLGETNPCVDRELVEVVRTLLQVDPAERYATAADLNNALLSVQRRLGNADAIPQSDEAKSTLQTVSRHGTGGRSWQKLVLAMFAPLGLLVLAAMIFNIRFRDGETVVVTINGSDESLKIDVDRESFTIADPRDGKLIHVSVDKGRRQLRFEKDGFASVGTQYDLSTPEGRSINIRFQPKVGGSTTAGDTSHRAIAEWVVSVGGRVVLNNGGLTVDDIEQLPASISSIDAVYLTRLNLHDDDLRILAGIDLEVSLYLQELPIRGTCLESIAKITQLRELLVQSCQVSNSENLNYLAGNSSLESIAVDGPLGDDLARVAITMPQLKYISLPQGSTGESLKLLAGCVGITQLATYSSTDIVPADFAELTKLPNLAILEMSFVQLTDESVNAINQCDGLKQLIISELEGSGDRNISLVGQLQGIEALTIWHADLTGVDLSGFAEMANLRSLKLNYTGLGPTQLTALSERLPDCVIETENWSSATPSDRPTD